MINITFLRANDNKIYVCWDYEYGQFLRAVVYKGKRTGHHLNSTLSRCRSSSFNSDYAAIIEIGTNKDGVEIGQNLETGEIVTLDFEEVTA